MKCSNFSSDNINEQQNAVIELKAIEPIKRGLWKTLNYESSTVNYVDTNLQNEPNEIGVKKSKHNQKVLEMPECHSEMVAAKLEEHWDELVSEVEL